MKKKQSCSIAVSAAQSTADRYHGAWGFFDNRIRRAIVSDAVVTWVSITRSACSQTLQTQSAEWLATAIEQWITEATELLASTYRMPLNPE